MKLSALTPEHESAKLEISSLIDVCFLLLVFFLVTASLVASEQDLSSTIPPKGTPAPSEAKPLFIAIDSKGVISTNQGTFSEILDKDATQRSVPALSQRLQTYAAILRASGKTPSVKLKADPETPYQRVIDVLNALREHEITEVNFHAN